MIATFARVLIGFALASLTAGLVQVLFVMSPVQMAQLPTQVFQERAAQAGVLSLLAATHAAIFAAAFALIAAGIGEWMRVHALAYYVATGAIIAALGFSAQLASEVAGQPTIFNNYAIAAFITSGALAGFVYWLVAGRYAGGRNPSDRADGGPEPVTSAQNPSEAPRTWRNRPRIIIEDPVAPGSIANKKATLAERIAEREEKRAADAGDGAEPSKPMTEGRETEATRKPESAVSSRIKPNEINVLAPKRH